jgi:hypothetical protein
MAGGQCEPARTISGFLHQHDRGSADNIPGERRAACVTMSADKKFITVNQYTRGLPPTRNSELRR